MSIFSNNSDKEHSEELLYEMILGELKPIMSKLDDKLGTAETAEGGKFCWSDPERTKVIESTKNVVLQYIWRRLGMKIPELSKMSIDNENNIIAFKNGNDD